VHLWREARPAGFWIRLVALLLDALLFAGVQASLDVIGRRVWGPGVEEFGVTRGLVVMCTALFTLLYTSVLHSVGGQTVGKMLVGIRVIGADGSPLPLGAAFLRHLAYALSALPCGVGFAMAGLRADKRALHDLVAGSRVERVPVPFRAGPTSAGIV
jgi:uncharacterized RDD family membrane protein YckC